MTSLARFELMPDFPRTPQADPQTGVVSRPLTTGHEISFTTCLTGLTALLARYTGEMDIVIGAFGLDASGDPTFTELQQRVDAAVPLVFEQPPLINYVKWNAPVDIGAVYDLNFILRGDCQISCEYNTHLYRASTIESLLEHLDLLLAGALKRPSCKLSDLSFITPGEQHRLIKEWNATAAEFPRDLCIHQMFEQTAARVPTAIAAVYGRQSITFAALDARANQLAHYLAARGAGAGSLIGIALDRSLEMLTAVLAVLKTGGAYLPLDPAFPSARLEFMAQDADIGLLITSRSLAGNVNTTAAAILIDEEWPAVDRAPATLLERSVTSDSLAYVLYTSGSTGKPKGVAIEHRSVINLLYGMQSHIQLQAGDSLLAVTTLSFDIAALELFLPWLTGARILLASQAQTADALALRDLLNETKPTAMQATPGTWRILVDANWQGIPGLKVLIGGEKVTRGIADALLDRGATVWNVYGPTETTVWSTVCRLERNGEPVSIGRPIANTSLYVLDSHLNPVPIGAPGELYIGGEGVARGYLNRPDLTAERFIRNPFGGEGRLYKTGDLVRYLPDGRVEILGRNDAQVKIRGFRIELGEVEGALAACPQVRTAAVVVRPAGFGEEVLVGYFVSDAGVDAATIRQALAARIPDYMVPAFLIPMAELPRTPNGKIDRNALPAPAVAAAPEGPLHLAADTLESTLISIWESTLGVHPLGVTDNFFELGGHSMLAAKIFARMEKVLGKTLPLATLFQAPTVEKLAAVIRKSEWKPWWSSLVPIRPAGTKPPFFFVHPIGGNVLNFSGFCEHFGPDQPIYGLQARGLSREEIPHISIEEMASDYIRSIRGVQPDGPYFIGGFSAGGLVAFEMTRQLESAGEQVSILALLDTLLDKRILGGHQSISIATRLHRSVLMVKLNLRYFSRMSLTEFLAKKTQNLKMRAKLAIWAIRARLGLSNDPASLNAEEAFLLAWGRYLPEPFYGNATLFRAGDGSDYSDPMLGWEPIIRGHLDIQEVSGDHDTFLQEPHIGMLAGLLEDCLVRAQSTDPRPAPLTLSSQTAERIAGLTPAIDMGKS